MTKENTIYRNVNTQPTLIRGWCWIIDVDFGKSTDDNTKRFEGRRLMGETTNIPPSSGVVSCFHFSPVRVPRFAFVPECTMTTRIQEKYTFISSLPDRLPP